MQALPELGSALRSGSCHAIYGHLPPRLALLPRLLIRFRRPVLVFLHLLLVPIGYMAAFGLRFDFRVPEPYLTYFASTLLLLLPIRLVSFAIFGLYRGWWRHVGMQDLMDLIKATTLSSTVFLAALFFRGDIDGFPRSILLLDWVLTIVLFGGVRFGVRAWRAGGHAGRADEPATLVIGAGQAAEHLLRQLRRGGGGIRVVGLVDDDPTKRRMRLHGVPVLGCTSDLQHLVPLHGVDLLVIAIPSATRVEMQRIVSRCIATGVEFKIVPSLNELLDGRARVSQLRKVEVEDLLGREVVDLDVAGVRDELSGKVVLITGGAGSIGSELARQIGSIGPRRLILVEQAESPLYFMHLELLKAFPGLDVVPVVADITDAGRMAKVFALHRPEYVFHTAAYKHVPLMEANVVEAVRNNILGTLCVAEEAARNGAEKFVLISTDKAVHPSSVMGATKRVAERIVLGWPSLRRSGTDFRAVRFGNVLGSDGSVLPLFRKQLATGGPLTVTHPDVTRYFMTIPEAVQLVLRAGALPEAAGSILMLEMGEPVRVVELAENLIRLSGLEPHKDVSIVYTGLRPGEKLHEELMSAVEATIATALDKVRIVQTDEVEGAAIELGLDRLATSVEVGETGEVVTRLCELVPECVPPLRDFVCRLSTREAQGLTEAVLRQRPR